MDSVIYAKRLAKKYRSDVWKLLCAADREFVPPLSARSDTTQQALGPGGTNESGPTEYFQRLIRQAFVLTVQDGRVIGFLSFIPDHPLQLAGETVRCDYISTIVVLPDCRNCGVTRGMYRKLFAERPDKVYATRTWSENHAHLHLLERLGFRLALRVRDDRGIGVDTVYYIKEDGRNA